MSAELDRDSGYAAEQAAAFAMADVSRETHDRLRYLVVELRRWQSAHNLVGPSTMDDVWSRHIADSLQLVNLEHPGGDWVDMGSGGGFPGLVVAMVRTERRQGTTHLIESVGKKCAFLRHVTRETGIDAVVHEGRIESVLPRLVQPVGVVSARALAPLAVLIGWSKQLLRNGALGIFPKGHRVEEELVEARRLDGVSAELRPSRTDRDGRIVLVRMSPQQDANNAA